MAYRSLRHLVVPAGLLAVVIGLQRSVALLGFDLHHDGLMFDAAFRLFNGEVPYRDFYYQYNLGTVLLHAGAIALFGPVVVSLKLVTVLAYSLIAVLVYLCAVRYVGVVPSLVVALAWSLLSPFYMPKLTGYHAWSSVYMMASAMLGAYLVLLSFVRASRFLALSGGFFICLAFWFKQVALIQLAGVTALLVAAALLPRSGLGGMGKYRFMVVYFLAGAMLCCLPFCIYLWYQDIWHDWWRSAFVFNGTWALEHRSGANIDRILDTFLHPHREYGYLSLVWAIVPVYLLVSILLVVLAGRFSAWLRSPAKLGWSLLAVLGLSGWIEYFPVPHGFHTQLFVAPIFPLIAIELGHLNSARISPARIPSQYRPLSIAILCLTLALLAHEVTRHIDGLARKLQQPWQGIALGSIADGLALLPEEMRSFERFQRSIRQQSEAHPGMLQIPLSVDPLRVLFPYVRSAPGLFKMGVDWSWSNEVVEPGFSSRQREKLKQRRMIVYSDSLLAIPGHIPVSVLEMRSSVSPVHFLYAPSRDPAPLKEYAVTIDWIGPVQIEDAPREDESSSQFPAFAVIPLPPDAHIPADAIENIHVSALLDRDIPRELSDIQFDWLKLRAAEVGWQEVPSLYEKRPNRHRLREDISSDEKLLLGRFFLNHGKLIRNLALPYSCSSLHDSPSRRPYLVPRMTNDSNPVTILWGNGAAAPDTKDARRPGGMALPLPSIYLTTEPITFYWLVVYKNKTTMSGYVRYAGNTKP